MSDANRGPEPLPVIPVNDPALPISEPMAALPGAPERRGHPLIAWMVILGCVIYLFVQSMRSEQVREKEEGATLGMQALKFQAKIIIGTANLTGMHATLYRQALALDTGTIDQRLRFIVVTEELAGPEEALNKLKDLKSKIARNRIEPTGTQKSLMEVLERLFTDYQNQKLEGPSISQSERALLTRELDWFGELALAPPGGPNNAAREAALQPAIKISIGYYVTFGVIIVLGFLGLVGVVLLLVFLLRGKLRSGVICGSFHGPVYAETFALWLLLFILLRQAASLIPDEWWPRGGLRFFAAVVIEFLTLGVLLWPVLRGIPWRQVRWETGLKLGRRPVLEPLFGLAGNVMSIPLLGLSLVPVLLLMHLQNRLLGTTSGPDSFSPPEVPSHPIVKQLGGAGWLAYLQVLVLASVAAPIIEETLFRGVLYRHLREATVKMGYALSVLFSALASSFVFAIIHPQGVIAVPALMALAFTFCLLREWRGTLIPGMVAHGASNAVVLLFAVTLVNN